MTSAVLVVVAAGALGPVQDRVEMTAAVATFQRLAAAIPAELPPSRSADERAAHAAQKARLDQLVNYVLRTQDVILAGKAHLNDYFNLMQVARDLVDTGAQLAVLPEERLCWHRAALNLAVVCHRISEPMRLYIQENPSTAFQGRAQVEFCRANYYRALADCLQTAPRP